jgi:hypothetical protein
VGPRIYGDSVDAWSFQSLSKHRSCPPTADLVYVGTTDIEIVYLLRDGVKVRNADDNMEHCLR